MDVSREFPGSIIATSQVSANRVNEGLNTETLTATKDLTALDAGVQVFDCATAQDVVLPDCTGTGNGELYGAWSVIVHVADSSTESVDVKTYDATTPALLKTVEPGETYQFINIGKSTAAGSWKVVLLEVPTQDPALRYAFTHDATTSWTDNTTDYSFSINSATHGINESDFVIATYSGATSPFVKVEPYVEYTDAGVVTVKVSNSPDGRYAGRVIIL